MKKHECKKCGETDPEKFYPKHKSSCKKCDNARARDRYRNLSEEDKRNYIDHQKKNFAKWIDTNTLRYRYNQAKNRARRKGLVFEITLDHLESLMIKQNGECPYTGVKLGNTNTKISNAGGIETVSLDRIDSNMGYVEGNVELVSSLVNLMKNDLDREEFLKLVSLIYETSTKS